MGGRHVGYHARRGIVYNNRKPRFHLATLFRVFTNRHYIGDVCFKGQ